MNPREKGFLLLTGFLGDPERKPLTTVRLRELTKKARLMEKPDVKRELTLQDLHLIGCGREEAERILHLLSQEEQLLRYVENAAKWDCYPLTRVSEHYPMQLRKALALEAPGSLWYKGEISILDKPKISLVGSRDLQKQNREFAYQVGVQSARQGYVLVSGHARGADKAAEEACLENGGQVISVVSDPLKNHPLQRNVLYLAEDGFEIAFSPYRALSRNRIIHALSEKTFVAQCTVEKGGTWDGTCKNLRHSWSQVFCYRDGSTASLELEQMGAVLIDCAALQDISSLYQEIAFF